MKEVRKCKLISRLCMIFAVTLMVAGLPFISHAANYPPIEDHSGHFNAVIGSNYSASGKAGEDAFIIFDAPENSYNNVVLRSAVSSNTSVVVPELDSLSALSDCLTLYYKKYGKATVTVTDNMGRVSIIEVTVTGHEPRLNQNLQAKHLSAQSALSSREFTSSPPSTSTEQGATALS